MGRLARAVQRQFRVEIPVPWVPWGRLGWKGELPWRLGNSWNFIAGFHMDLMRYIMEEHGRTMLLSLWGHQTCLAGKITEWWIYSLYAINEAIIKNRLRTHP
jgi:hypothetical protein